MTMRTILSMAMVAVLSGAFVAWAKPKAEADPHKGMLRHVVLFKFKEGTTQKQIDAVVKHFGELPGQIDAIKGYEWGPVNNVEKHLQNGYSHAFTVTFKDRAGLEAYLPHPDHKKFVDRVVPLLDTVQVADYVVQ